MARVVGLLLLTLMMFYVREALIPFLLLAYLAGAAR
ncbi:hypothetical protein SAMN06295937_101151 [Sphingopyxis flava]|uniref:Uncharacterized protein n=1 Tax=Sphingopyxis flava TaxID=1507287 RepID=A0A1T5CRF1_9SPHN|nr:hypothetical protein SAMN06295937_101151 [Sphingopyxis flava]